MFFPKFFNFINFYTQKTKSFLWNSAIKNSFAGYVVVQIFVFWSISCKVIWKKSNKTRTSKVGAISKAQKAQNIFLEKKLEIFEKKIFQKKSHSAEKCKMGTLLDLLTYIPLQNIKKLEGRTLWGHLKIFEKKSTVPKKPKGGPFRHVRVCR